MFPIGAFLSSQYPGQGVRIAIFTDTFLPQINGIVTVTASLAEHLADRGHHVYIIAPKYKGVAEYRHPGVTVKRVPSVPAFFYEEFRFTPFPNLEIISYLKKERIDIIHFQTPVTLGLQAVMTARVLKLPLVGTYHTLFSDPQYLRHIKLGSHLAQRLSWSYAAMYYDRCDLITCPTEIVKEELLAHGFKRPIRAISNGIELDTFDNTGWKEKKRKYNPDGKLLLFTGRIAHEKNINYLLDCFARIRKEVPGTKLLIVGDGPQMEEVRAHSRALHLAGEVIFAGRMERKQLLASGIFKACDVFVTASTTETQCISVLEAQANGLPTVGVKERGVTEVVRNRVNGFLVENGDKEAFVHAVVRLLKDDTLRARLGKNAMRDVRKHDMGHIARVWEREYAALFKR